MTDEERLDFLQKNHLDTECYFDEKEQLTMFEVVDYDSVPGGELCEVMGKSHDLREALDLAAGTLERRKQRKEENGSDAS